MIPLDKIDHSGGWLASVVPPQLEDGLHLTCGLAQLGEIAVTEHRPGVEGNEIGRPWFGHQAACQRLPIPDPFVGPTYLHV